MLRDKSRKFVSKDERDRGLRKILNFGHTIGHALEAVTSYPPFQAWRAVGYGMIAASRIALKMGDLARSKQTEFPSLVHASGRLPHLSHIDPEVPARPLLAIRRCRGVNSLSFYPIVLEKCDQARCTISSHKGSDQENDWCGIRNTRISL